MYEQPHLLEAKNPNFDPSLKRFARALFCFLAFVDWCPNCWAWGKENVVGHVADDCPLDPPNHIQFRRVEWKGSMRTFDEVRAARRAVPGGATTDVHRQIVEGIEKVNNHHAFERGVCPRCLVPKVLHIEDRVGRDTCKQLKGVIDSMVFMFWVHCQDDLAAGRFFGKCFASLLDFWTYLRTYDAHDTSSWTTVVYAMPEIILAVGKCDAWIYESYD